MINYSPITLYSIESKKSIWLEIRSSVIESGKEYLNLHIHCRSGTMDSGKLGKGFYQGPEEGYSQTIFRMLVLKSELEALVKNIRTEMNPIRPMPGTLNINFSHLYNNQSQLLFQILKPITESNFSVQIGYIKEEFESYFQIQTSSEAILLFIDKLDQKIKKYNKNES